jgi:hypothetical protein
MSQFGTKRTWRLRSAMSAFGGKADMTQASTKADYRFVRLSAYSGKPSGLIQLTLLLVCVLSRGGSRFGSSRLHVVTSISPGKSACSNVSCVPQRGQNDRVPFSVELNRRGRPLTIRKAPDSMLNQVTNGAPVVPRQIEQWQLVSWKGAPSASYRIAPQKQPPRSIGTSSEETGLDHIKRRANEATRQSPAPPHD